MKWSWFSLGICFVAVIGCGPATCLTVAQNIQQSEPEEGVTEQPVVESDVADRVAVEDVMSDDRIERRLTKILTATGWFDDVTVDVRESLAFMDGTAVTDEHRQWAGRLARNTEGVAAVVNRIKVKKVFQLSESMGIMANSLSTLWQDFLVHSPLIIAGLVVVVLTSLGRKIIHMIASPIIRKSRLRSSLQDLILQLVTIGVWIVGLLIAAVIVFPGMTPAKALTVLGLGSVAIGFAFKDIFENFFAGILILWRYPFDKGDFIECGAIRGRIEDITIRTSMIRQVDGQLVVVPNATLFKNPVDVLTSQPARRTTVICGVAYDTDLKKASDTIQEAVKGCSTVNKDDLVEIFAQEFAASSINFEVTWWTGATPREQRESRDQVVRAVKRALDHAGIEIPFPQRTLWLPQPIRTATS